MCFLQKEEGQGNILVWLEITYCDFIVFGNIHLHQSTRLRQLEVESVNIIIIFFSPAAGHAHLHERIL